MKRIIFNFLFILVGFNALSQSVSVKIVDPKDYSAVTFGWQMDTTINNDIQIIKMEKGCEFICTFAKEEKISLHIRIEDTKEGLYMNEGFKMSDMGFSNPTIVFQTDPTGEYLAPSFSTQIEITKNLNGVISGKFDADVINVGLISGTFKNINSRTDN